MSGSNYCFLTCTQVSQEAGKIVRYSHLLKNFPQFVVIHTVQGFSVVNETEIDVFFPGIPLLFLWSNGYFQFDLWFICLFQIGYQFSRSVMSHSLWPHEPHHARPPCPSPIVRVYPNSCPLSQWCHPTISSSVVPFSSYLQSFPASGSFHMSNLLTSGGKVLEFQLQHQSYQWTPRTGLL